MKILKLNVGSHTTSDEFLSDELVIGIKKDEHSNIIIDKDCYRRLDDKLERIYTDKELLEKGFTKVKLDSKYVDCIADDFNDDLTFNVEKYNARKQKESAKTRITELKQLLKDYDYIGTKIATGRGTREQYATEIAQMTAWADEINELEASL